MGLIYRKSINLGPFRVNLSGSGIGYSVGGRGFRVGKSSRGRNYTAFSIPGTGVGYRSISKGSGKGCGCLILIAAIPSSLALSNWILTSPH
jgi:hypothetical protein